MWRASFNGYVTSSLVTFVVTFVSQVTPASPILGPFSDASSTYYCNPPAQVCAPDSGLTAVPNQLFDSTTKSVYLFNNSIVINATRDFLGSPVNQLDLESNGMTSFPCLPNIKTTLTHLALAANNIKVINNTTCIALLQKLSFLGLEDNQLTALADFALPTLNQIYMSGNRFTEIPALPLLGQTLNFLGLMSNTLLTRVNPQALLGYQDLATLKLTYSSLTTLPNYCTMTPSKTVKLLLVSNPLYCDCRLLWMVTYTGAISVSAACAGPPSLASMSLATINPALLTCTGQMTTSFVKAASNFYCANPYPVARYAVPGVLACASKCKANSYCSSFNIGRRTDVTGSVKNMYYCDIAGLGSTLNLTTSVATDWTFYVVD